MKSRSSYFSVLAAAFVSVCALALNAADYKLGVQTWTLRALNFDQVVEFCVKNELKYLQAISSHIDPKGSKEETLRKKKILDDHGLKVYTFGVAGTSTDKEENRKLFEFAKLMEIEVIIVEPRDFSILDNLEELAKEYDVKVAIHNHGITSLYGNPLVVRNLIKHRDKRIGVCMDAGWITSTRMDAAKVFRDYEGRVYDIHLKDKVVNSTPRGDVATPAAIGQGSGNLKGLFKELKSRGYQGVMAIETDHRYEDPTQFVADAKKFVEANY